MKLVLTLVAAVALQSGTASAIERYRANNMSCSAIQDAIQKQGAVILQFPSSHLGMTLYDRFARSKMECGVGTYPAYTTVKTRDNKACEVQVCHTDFGHSDR